MMCIIMHGGDRHQTNQRQNTYEKTPTQDREREGGSGAAANSPHWEKKRIGSCFVIMRLVPSGKLCGGSLNR